jgi:signal transduction histidine kinase
LEQIVYVASHDLRSPLVNVDGYGRELQYLVEELRTALGETGADELDVNAAKAVLPEMTDALRHIRNSTAQMDALLKGLLRLSRLGRSALCVEALDMNELMARIVSSFEFQIRSAGIALEIGELPSCQGDAVQVAQVFSNLLGNAVKYIDPQRSGLIRISGGAELGRSVYCVEDNGIGIAAEHQNKIFELFHRLNPAETEGEGLGLTIVRQLVGRLGGEIRLESQPGEGSRFFVTLPAARHK